MSTTHEVLEKVIEEFLARNGFKIVRDFHTRGLKPDIVAEAPDKAVVFAEVKESSVAVPDILSMASSSVSSSQYVGTIVPTIFSTKPSPRGMSDLAKASGVIIVTIDQPSEQDVKLSFLVKITQIESRLRQLANVDAIRPFALVVQELVSKGTLTSEQGTTAEKLWAARNMLVHDFASHGDFESSYLDNADAFLKSINA